MGRSPGWPLNRFSAPMICSRSRSGRACTAAEPSCRAAPAKRGHRSATTARSGTGGDRVAGAEAVQARAFVVLQLEQFQQPGAFGGGGHYLQTTALVGEHDPRRGGIQQAHAVFDQPVEQISHVVSGDQRVSQFHERLGQFPFPSHRDHLSPMTGAAPINAGPILWRSVRGRIPRAHARLRDPHRGSGFSRSRRATISSATSPTRLPCA